MPYVVLKKKSAVQGQEDVMVVPDGWLESLEDEPSFVFLPVADCDTIKTYLEEKTAPLPGWKKHECEILCLNIPNLISAYTTIDKLLNETSLEDFTGLFNPPPPKKRLKRNELQTKPVPVVEESVPEEDEKKVFPILITGQEIEDPFGDINPPLEMPLLSDPLQVGGDVAAAEKRENTGEGNLYTPIETKEENDPLGGLVTVIPHSILASDTSMADHHGRYYQSRSSNKKVFSLEHYRQSYEPPSDNDAPNNYDDPSDDDAPSDVDALNNDDTQSWHSRTKVQSKTDPVVDGKQIAQLYDLINELKTMMIRNQEEIKKNIHESFTRMQDTMVSMIKQHVPKDSNMVHHVNISPNRPSQSDVLHFSRLKDIEEVKQFDRQLNNEVYLHNFYNMIYLILKNKTNSTVRMKTVLFVIFEQELFEQFSWGGQNGKESLQKYTNITKVLQCCGTTPTQRITAKDVADFIQGLVKSVPTLPIDTTVTITPVNPTPVNNIVLNTPAVIRRIDTSTNNTTIKPVRIIKVIDDVNSTRDAQTRPEPDPSRKAVQNNFSNKDKCLTSVKVLESFENRLNDLTMQQQVHKWIDKTVGDELDVEKRLVKLFNRLIDVKVLQSFFWKRSKAGHRPFAEYRNFIQLFVYASNVKKLPEPTLAMRERVNVFLRKQLSYAEWCTQRKNPSLPSTSRSGT